jgi:benzylsuccinate CoA-transferase BbsF subunit
MHGDLIYGMENMQREKILDGIRIVEFGWAVVGPLTCSWAGNYGAEVIKVETSTKVDVIRMMPPFKDDKVGINTSLFFGRENASKYSIALNLAQPEAVEVAKRLICLSDVVLDSYTSGVMGRLGLSYENLKKLKPDLIMISSCMYGQTGAYSSMPGYGVPLTAISGLTEVCGWPDRKPTGPYGSYTDYLVPRFNLLAIIAALDYRRRTRKGLYLDASQYEASVQFIAPLLLDFFVNKRINTRHGNSCPYAAPHGVYRCHGNDRWCAITVFNDEQWSGFCNAVGNPSWTQESKFSTALSRKKYEEELNQLVEKWTSEHTAKEVMAVMQRYGVPAGILNNGEDLGDDPQLKQNHYYHRLEHPEIGMMDYPSASIKFSKTAEEIFRSPCLGEHTEYICKNIIGLSDEEFETYSAKGVFV